MPCPGPDRWPAPSPSPWPPNSAWPRCSCPCSVACPWRRCPPTSSPCRRRARWWSHAPLGTLGVGHVLALGALVLTGAVVRSRRGRLALVAAAAVVLVQPVAALATTGVRQSWSAEPVAGTRLWRAGGATVLGVDRAL